MNFKEFMKPKKKEKIISVRVATVDYDLLKKKKVSPSKLFDFALEELKKKK